MNDARGDIFVGQTPLWQNVKATTGDFVTLLGETYYRIRHVDQMPPFFMTLVSSTDHWLFIASNGGLTAGRINAESALFPYETEDKIVAHAGQTGAKTIIRATRAGRRFLWEPFSDRYAGLYHCHRHLYKNIPGSSLVFEEVNHDLDLTVRTAWRTSDRFGFVRSCWLVNDGDTGCQVELLDGFQNLLPYGATTDLQSSLSSLLDAYKRNELETVTGLGIFALSATLTDLPEPSESLQATVAWQVGLEAQGHLLSVDQLDAFRHGRPLDPEHDIRGRAGAYFVNASFELMPGQTRRWHVAADVNQDSVAVDRLVKQLHQGGPLVEQQLDADLATNRAGLTSYVAAADGLQLSAQKTTTTHHFANVLFNIMRGGIFDHGYWLAKHDLIDFIRTRNRSVASKEAGWLAALPERLKIADLYDRASAAGSPDLIRLCYEYLPLTFSRRHGDPSRPWNQFSINIKRADGSPRLDYQGNWRDIFQNWEPLVLSFPAYAEGLIAKFLNATTADGYNPYRVTRAGIEWETPEPDNPWANIGYWSDHQIIYLQKLLEIMEQLHPGKLRSLWNSPVYATANVPYRLRPYSEMLSDWSNTIDFDWESEEAILVTLTGMGTDARLHLDGGGNVNHVTMMEKLLVLLLAKISNLVPDGGIWMNTQRPEWNDANNALVGKGLSVVSAAYLRRFITFWRAQLAEAEANVAFAVNAAVAALFSELHATLAAHQDSLETHFDPSERRTLMDRLGDSISRYRSTIYQEGIAGERIELEAQRVGEFLDLAQRYIDQTLIANRRKDGLYHAYNLLRLSPSEAAVDHLYPMLEGQVAILSSGLLPPDEALALLHTLRQTDLYRADQHTYLLYPDRDLPGFLTKNNVTSRQLDDLELVDAMTAAADPRLLVHDQSGVYHFNGAFRNVNDLMKTLEALAEEPAYADLVLAGRDRMIDLFETTFNHKAFTGRSGTFFGYEGLGSVYWHMVSKLLLAVQECYLAATQDPAANSETVASLAAAYHDIRDGLGFNKTPAEYGAFPMDPYSHTPAEGGARQPGMTGQVKEEILTRFGELGVFVRGGVVSFSPTLLPTEEFLTGPDSFAYVDVNGQRQTLSLKAGALAFTLCQTPVVYIRGDQPRIEVSFVDGKQYVFDGSSLDAATSRHIFERDGQVSRLNVTVGI